jgi:D-beta-D-heptose 7-phosphate kinase/D-beta-D-heptose 1-phosphate adenosyltransferase
VCARLHELYGTKHLVITLGEEGMLLSSNGAILKTIPTAAREVFDVSGAGDTSLAALVLALAAGAPLETAAQFANAAAGVVVGKLGTATVTPQELIAYVNHR